MVGANSGGEEELEVLGFLDSLGGDISGVEGGGDKDVEVGDVLLQL